MKSLPRIKNRYGLNFLLIVLVWQLMPLAAADIPNPQRYEDTIAEFEDQDRENMPLPGGIVLTGSSSIMFWNEEAPEDLAPLSVIPRGFGGSVMNDVLYFLDRVALNYRPRAILIYEGDNDTGRNSIPNEQILDQLQQIIARIHSALPDTRIYLLSVKPSISREETWPVALELNRSFQSLVANDPLMHYVDVATPFLESDGTVMRDIFVHDDLHLNDKGYRIWADTIRTALMKTEARYEE